MACRARCSRLRISQMEIPGADGLDIGLKAFGWGILSAVSLPLGALFGVFLKPNKKINSAFMAFGAGALLFALTIELFGKAIHESEQLGPMIVFSVMAGAIIGGLLFDILNQLLNSKGAFARSLSTARRYLVSLKRSKATKLVEELSEIPILASLPPEIIAELIPNLTLELYEPDAVIFRQGDTGDALYFILRGRVGVFAEKEGQMHEIACLGENDIVGEIALISDVPRTATARCLEDTHLYRLSHRDFIRLMESQPEVKEKFTKLAEQRVTERHQKAPSGDSEQWAESVKKRIARVRLPVTDKDIHNETKAVLKKGAAAAFAIWLGILIDAVPESLVIGMLTKNISGVSFAFIAGVFLANLPEAMSSSTTMLKGGMAVRKILLMWVSLMILTGIGAYLGALLFPAHPTGNISYVVGGIEGLAAGAMLAMIAETMLPEAFDQGGAIVGMSTLMGFLTALTVKILV